MRLDAGPADARRVTSSSRTRTWRGSALLVLLGVLPLALLTWTSLSAAESAVRHEASSRVETAATTSALLVGQQISAVERLVESYANRTLIVDALGDGNARGFDQVVIQEKLGQLLDNQDGPHGTFLSDADGVLRAVEPASPGVVGVDFSYRDWFTGVRRNGGTYVSEAYRTALVGNPLVVTVATPVTGRGGEVIGVLGAVVGLEALQRYASGMAEIQQIDLTIADQNGALLARPSSLRHRVREDDPRIAAALDGRSGLLYDHELSSYQPVPELGWAVVADVDPEVAFAGVRAMSTRVLVIAAVCTLLLLGAGVGLHRIRRSRERDRQQLEERERALSSVLGAATDGFISVTDDGRVTAWNAAAEQLFGWSREEALGRDLVGLVMAPGLHARHAAAMSAYRPGGASTMVGKRVDLEAQHRDGRRLPVEVSVWACDDGGWSAFVRDISERTTARQQLEKARDEAMEGSRLKSEFLANMSHEIRTPMNGVIGMSALLEQSDLTPVQRDWAETARSSAEALLTVLDDILDVSKIEAGQLDVEHADVDLRDVVEGSAALLAARAQEKGVELSCYVDPRLPERVVGDPVRLRQVVLNLVGNAVKFTEHGSVRVEVLVRRIDAEVVDLDLVVADTGIGMSDDVLARVFEPFVQADSTTTRRFGGTGLGLPITRSSWRSWAGR